MPMQGQVPGQPPRAYQGQPQQRVPGQPMPPMAQMPQMPGQPPMMQRPPMGMPNPMGMPPQMVPQPMGMPRAPGQPIPIQLQYVQQAQRLVPAVDQANPNYKQQVGEVIYEFVEKISTEDLAPKITGMLIDLPLEDIRAYLTNFSILEEKVKQAESLLQDK